jgi:hypothetical protein
MTFLSNGALIGRVFHLLTFVLICVLVLVAAVVFHELGESGACKAIAMWGGVGAFFYFVFGGPSSYLRPTEEDDAPAWRAWRCGEVIIDLEHVVSIDRVATGDSDATSEADRRNDGTEPSQYQDTIVRYTFPDSGTGSGPLVYASSEVFEDVFVLTDDEHEDLCDAFEDYTEARS